VTCCPLTSGDGQGTSLDLVATFFTFSNYLLQLYRELIAETVIKGETADYPHATVFSFFGPCLFVILG